LYDDNDYNDNCIISIPIPLLSFLYAT